MCLGEGRTKAVAYLGARYHHPAAQEARVEGGAPGWPEVYLRRFGYHRRVDAETLCAP